MVGPGDTCLVEDNLFATSNEDGEDPPAKLLMKENLKELVFGRFHGGLCAECHQRPLLTLILVWSCEAAAT